MVRDVLVHLGFCLGRRLSRLAQFKTYFGLLIADFVVRLFQFLEVELLPAPVGELDCGFPVLVLPDFFRLAGFGGGAGAGLVFVSQSIDVSASIGKDTLHRQ